MNVFQAVCSVHFSFVQDRTKESHVVRKKPHPKHRYRRKQVGRWAGGPVDQPEALKCASDLVYGVLHLTVFFPVLRAFHFSFDIFLRLPADALRVHGDNRRFCCIHCYVPYVAVY
jgi:hypothetical protein